MLPPVYPVPPNTTMVDMLHLVIREEQAAHAYAVLESGPEDD